MPLYSEKLEKSIKKNINIAFKIAPGTVLGKIYKPMKEDNIYRDKELYYDKTSYVEVKMYLNLEPPAKVVKNLGWWKEDENLPILCYMPFVEDFYPEKDDKISVTEEGYLTGDYLITNTKMYGTDSALCWVCGVVPKRGNIKESASLTKIKETKNFTNLYR